MLRYSFFGPGKENVDPDLELIDGNEIIKIKNEKTYYNMFMEYFYDPFNLSWNMLKNKLFTGFGFFNKAN